MYFNSHILNSMQKHKYNIYIICSVIGTLYSAFVSYAYITHSQSYRHHLHVFWNKPEAQSAWSLERIPCSPLQNLSQRTLLLDSIAHRIKAYFNRRPPPSWQHLLPDHTIKEEFRNTKQEAQCIKGFTVACTYILSNEHTTVLRLCKLFCYLSVTLLVNFGLYREKSWEPWRPVTSSCCCCWEVGLCEAWAVGAAAAADTNQRLVHFMQQTLHLSWSIIIHKRNTQKGQRAVVAAFCFLQFVLLNLFEPQQCLPM